MQTKSNEDIIKEFGQTEIDSGSTSVQIAILTKDINYLTEHLKIHKKDKHSRHGLIKMVNKRRKLLQYLHRTNTTTYQQLIKKLQLRG